MWSLLKAFSIQRYIIFMCVKLTILREKWCPLKVIFLGIPDYKVLENSVVVSILAVNL